MEQEESYDDHEREENVEREGNRKVWNLVIGVRDKEPESVDRRS